MDHWNCHFFSYIKASPCNQHKHKSIRLTSIDIATVEKKKFMPKIMKSSPIVGVIVLLAFSSSAAIAAAFDPEIGRVQLSTLLQSSVGRMLSEFGHRAAIAKRQTIYDVTAKDVIDCISSATEYQCGASGYSQRVVDIAMGCNNDSYARNTANTCARNENGDTCGAVTLKFLSDYTNADACSGAVSSGFCHESCRDFLQSAKKELGCCVNAYVNKTDYPLYRQYRQYVDYLLWDLCDVDLPDGECKDGGLSVKPHSQDQKSCSPQELISRFVRYECSADVGQSLINNLMKNDRCYIFSSVMVDACSTNTHGQYCAEVIGIDLMANVISDPLVISLNSYCTPGSGCTASCRNAIMDVKKAYGCCVNIYNDTSIGLQLTPLSYDVWNKCGIETPGFCDTTQVIPTIQTITTTESVDSSPTENTQTTESFPDTSTKPVPPTPFPGEPVDNERTPIFQTDAPEDPTDSIETTEIFKTPEEDPTDSIETTDIFEMTDAPEDPTETTEIFETPEEDPTDSIETTEIFEMTDAPEEDPTDDIETTEIFEITDAPEDPTDDDIQTTEIFEMPEDPTDDIETTEIFEMTDAPEDPTDDDIQTTEIFEMPEDPTDDIETTEIFEMTDAPEEPTDDTEIFETTDIPEEDPTDDIQTTEIFEMPEDPTDDIETTEISETTDAPEEDPTDDIQTTEMPEDPTDDIETTEIFEMTDAPEEPTETTQILEMTDAPEEDPTDDIQTTENFETIENTPTTETENTQGIATTAAEDIADDVQNPQTTESTEDGPTDSSDHESDHSTTDEPIENDHSDGEDHSSAVTTEAMENDHEDHSSAVTTGADDHDNSVVSENTKTNAPPTVDNVVSSEVPSSSDDPSPLGNNPPPSVNALSDSALSTRAFTLTSVLSTVVVALFTLYL